jgi:hypothetical protein
MILVAVDIDLMVSNVMLCEGGMLVRTPGGKVAYHRMVAMTVAVLGALALRTVHCNARRRPHLQPSMLPRWGQHHQTRSSS